MNQIDDKVIEACAAAAHMANRAHCRAIGDDSQPLWEDAPDWQKKSARNGVIGVLVHGNGPGASHESWLAEKEADGWKYGPVKDPAKKEHPCFVQFDQLPPEQQAKDYIFVDTVKQVFAALS